MPVPYDGNIPWTSDRELLKKKVGTLSALGYGGFMVNYTVEEILPKAKKGTTTQSFETANKVVLSTDELISTGSQNLHQLSRYTAIIKDDKQGHLIQLNDQLARYDVRSVEPTSNAIFQQLCRSTGWEFDIISLDMTEKMSFFVNRTDVEQAISNGIFFEIKYSPMIRDRNVRRNIISNAQNLVNISKGKNIIISSACEKAIELRGPYDVTNLSLLFGFNQSEAKCAVTTNYRNLIMKVQTRKAAFGALSVMKVSDLNSDQCSVGDDDDNQDNENNIMVTCTEYQDSGDHVNTKKHKLDNNIDVKSKKRKNKSNS